MEPVTVAKEVASAPLRTKVVEPFGVCDAQMFVADAVARGPTETVTGRMGGSYKNGGHRAPR